MKYLTLLLLVLVGCAADTEVPECDYPSAEANIYRSCIANGGDNCVDQIIEAYGCKPVIPTGTACYQSVSGTGCDSVMP